MSSTATSVRTPADENPSKCAELFGAFAAYAGIFAHSTAKLFAWVSKVTSLVSFSNRSVRDRETTPRLKVASELNVFCDPSEEPDERAASTVAARMRACGQLAAWPPPPDFYYHLRNRTSGAVIDLGCTAELTPELAKLHGIDVNPLEWNKEWAFYARRGEALPAHRPAAMDVARKVVDDMLPDSHRVTAARLGDLREACGWPREMGEPDQPCCVGIDTPGVGFQHSPLCPVSPNGITRFPGDVEPPEKPKARPAVVVDVPPSLRRLLCDELWGQLLFASRDLAEAQLVNLGDGFASCEECGTAKTDVHPMRHLSSCRVGRVSGLIQQILDESEPARRRETDPLALAAFFDDECRELNSKRKEPAFSKGNLNGCAGEGTPPRGESYEATESASRAIDLCDRTIACGKFCEGIATEDLRTHVPASLRLR
jgi:hypothetical protein